MLYLQYLHIKTQCISDIFQIYMKFKKNKTCYFKVCLWYGLVWKQLDFFIKKVIRYCFLEIFTSHMKFIFKKSIHLTCIYKMSQVRILSVCCMSTEHMCFYIADHMKITESSKLLIRLNSWWCLNLALALLFFLSISYCSVLHNICIKLSINKLI